MKYENDAEGIVAAVGGEANITSLYHCISRLRLTLADRGLVDDAAVRAVPAVQATNVSGAQYQVIIGNDVPRVFEAVVGTHPALAGRVVTAEGSAEAVAPTPTRGWKGARDGFFSFLSSTFVPLVPAIAGAGLIKGLLALLVWVGWLETTAQTYQLLYALGDGFFYLLPVAVAISAARTLKSNVFVAAALMGALLQPGLITLLGAGEPVTFLGVPVTATSYGYTVIPSLLAVWGLSWVERGLKRVLPAALHLTVVPLVSLLVMGPLTLTAIGPLGTLLGNGVSDGLTWLLENGGLFAGLLIGGLLSLIIMTGMHAALVPFILSNLSQLGHDPFLPLTYVQVMGVAGACVAIALRARSAQVKAVGGSAALSALMGVTEPGIFGLLVPMRRAFLASMIGGALGGAVSLGFGANAYVLVGNSGLPGIPGLIGPGMQWAVLAMVVAFVGSFVSVLLIGFDESPLTRAAAPATSAPAAPAGSAPVSPVGAEVVLSPVTGTAVPLGEVPDKAFSSFTMGRGAAVVPTVGEVVAPFDGEVVAVFGTKHVVGLRSDSGVEVLVHVGIDTVDLAGRPFTAHVATGDHVTAGQQLLTFDLAEVAATHNPVTLVVVTNTASFEDVDAVSIGSVEAGDALITVARATVAGVAR